MTDKNNSINQINHIFVPIEGMHCAACVTRVENGLKKVQGIESVNVNLSAAQAAVGFDSDRTRLQDILSSVEQTGYTVKKEKTFIAVPGMQDTAMASRAEKLLERMEGILRVDWNAASESLMLEYIPGVADFQKIKKRFREKFSLDVTIEDSAVQSEQNIWETHQQTAQKLFYKVIAGILFSAVVFVLSMPDLFPFVKNIGAGLRWYSVFVLTSLVLFGAGLQFFTGFWKALKVRTADMNTLIAIGSGTAYLYSALVIFLQGVQTTMPIYFDTAAMITAFILVGRYLEARAKSQTTGALKHLAALQPKTANKIDGDQITTIPSAGLQPRDICLVKSGEHIPADGILLDEYASVDESMLSGEGLPVEKKKGDMLIGGTINGDNPLQMKVLKTGSETALAGIINLVKQAQSAKPAIQKLADRIAAVFVPIVLSIAALTFLLWWLGGAGLITAMVNFIAVVVIACPCALGLATPTAIMVASGRGARQGILIKNSNSLETFIKIDALLLDKTGTVTSGQMKVAAMTAFHIAEPELLRLAASLENQSNHPIARAIVSEAGRRDVKISPAEKIRIKKGAGIVGQVDGKTALLGSPTMFEKRGITISSEQTRIIDDYAARANTVILFAVENQLQGIIAIADTIKDEAAALIKRFQSMHKKVIILTGDNAKTAKAVALKINADDWHAGCTPQSKAAIIKEMQEKGQGVAMVGDGINDAVALTQADVGIAIGSGADVAIDSADIVLLNNNLNDIVSAYTLSKRTVRIIKENLFWAFGYNVLMIPAAAGLLFVLIGVMFNPVAAALAMAFSSFSVVLNSLRLKGIKL